jgi:radical SAM superfamily enzyme YgiQ (UPF0313 family)
MKITLVAPRCSRRPMDSLWKVRMSPPLGLLTIGALTPPGHEVTLADENVERCRFNDSPDLVGITVKADTFYRACEIAALYRSRGARVVMGGIHPTVCPDECAPHTDAVVVGEAELLWPRAIADALQGRLQARYVNDGPVDIALAPVPRWELLRPGRYLFTNTLCAGRGCPWRCDFCYNSSPNLDARFRMKPVVNILAEIKSLGIRHVMFIDDNFIGDPKRAWELVSAMRPLRLTWHAAVSADIHRHPALLDAMAESGCRTLFIGFETVNPRNLADCHKGQNRTEAYDCTIAMIHERGMMVNASVVFGFDNDGPEVFDDTVDWLERNHVSTMTAHILTPYPGTRLYRQFEEQGRITDRDLRHYNTSHVVFRPAGMSAEDLAGGYRRAYERFYSWSSIRKRWPVAAGQAVAYLEFNLLYRKFGKFTSILGSAIGMRALAKAAKAFAYPSEPPDDMFDYRPSRRGVAPCRPLVLCSPCLSATAEGAVQ